jgi:hypothetical protein
MSNFTFMWCNLLPPTWLRASHGGITLASCVKSMSGPNSRIPSYGGSGDSPCISETRKKGNLLMAMDFLNDAPWEVKICSPLSQNVGGELVELRAQPSGPARQLLPWPRFGYWCCSWHWIKTADMRTAKACMTWVTWKAFLIRSKYITKWACLYRQRNNKGLSLKVRRRLF